MQESVPAAADGDESGDEMLSTAQVAQMMGLKKNTLEVYRCSGRGPLFVKYGGRGSGGRVMYRRRDVLAWIESRIRHSTSDDGTDGVRCSA